MNKLPQDLINYIKSFAPDHRLKYRHVLNQLTVLKDSSLVDRIIYLARGKLYFQNKELHDIHKELIDDEDMASFEEYQERLIEYLEIKYDKKKKEPFSSGRSKWKDLYWAIDNRFSDHYFYNYPAASAAYFRGDYIRDFKDHISNAVYKKIRKYEVGSWNYLLNLLFECNCCEKHCKEKKYCINNESISRFDEITELKVYDGVHSNYVYSSKNECKCNCVKNSKILSKCLINILEQRYRYQDDEWYY